MKTNFKFLGFFAIAMISSVCFAVANVTSQTVDDSNTIAMYDDAQAFDVADLLGGDPFVLHKYDLEMFVGHAEVNPIKTPRTDAKSERMERRYRAGINNGSTHKNTDYSKRTRRGIEYETDARRLA